MDSNDCDPATDSRELSGVTAEWIVSNTELDSFWWDQLEEAGSTCHKECQKNADCYVYEINVDDECVSSAMQYVMQFFIKSW